MNENATAEAPMDTQTPTDTPTPSGKKRAKPRRFRLFDDGAGDFRIYEVIGEGQKLPKGTMVPVPEFPGAESAIDAKKLMRAHGEKFPGKTFLIFRGVEMVRIFVESKPQVKIESKPRKQVSGPVAEQPSS